MMGFLLCRLFHGIQWVHELDVCDLKKGKLILGVCNCGKEYFFIPIEKKE